ncbi:Peptide-N4-(N-acetyl-beta-glucosaminyl)asparagine amidase A [Cardamine amara subsp. amara]|uniref:Peptide-N4-(N-acetyl-beta-glucosaminyl)asparagine amidase A n=1 Tax=Cardamine amara subsp. amara TaxID=228776 RepID=A0ABD1A8J9_CARAN
MTCSLPPVIFFTIFFIAHHSLSTVADLHQTRSRFKPPQFSPLFFSPPPQNVTTTSPTRYFEVNKPPVPDLPTSQPPCSYRILHHDFGYTYAKPPVLANYTLPSHCSSREFSKIVLEFQSTSKGRQFDRIFGLWLNGVELLRSCTAEPKANGIVWSVEKDVTKYHSILVKNETQILSVYLGNLIDKIYTGVYHVDVIFHFYPFQRTNLRDSSSGYSSAQADMILPISRSLPLNDGLWFEILNQNDCKYKEVEIPRNAYRAVLEVYVSFHENDEFWYGNLPNDFLTANNLSVAGNGPFREVVVSIDGKVVGAVWPFPVVFTGGINPLLWRPISAIGSFDLPSYDIEITPFLGSLLDGKTHKVEFSVTNALNVWYIDANLHLWLDQEKEIVEGKVLEISKSSLAISSVSEFKGLNGNFTTKAKRSITSIGLVKSSHGDIITNANQEFSYENKMVLGKDGSMQIIDQLIQADDRIHAKRASREIYCEKSSKSFPFYLYSDSLEQRNHTSLEIANVSMGFNEERSERDNGLMKTFKSKLENKQEGQGVMVVKDHLVTSGYGSTQQVYKYIGSDQCYFRNISSSNYTILYDKLETVCKKKTLKLRHGSASKQTPTLTGLIYD